MGDGGLFKDRRGEMFGRMRVLETLRHRAERPGLTALVGRPQAGKSWLVEELARTLTDDHECIVGYHQSGGAPDNVLRAVQDLYIRWLSNSSYREQARLVWQAQSGGLLTGAAQVLSKVFGEMPGVSKPAGELVKSAILSLLQARQDLRTGRLALSPIQGDQARELLALVHNISERSLVVVLDAWEQSDASTLQAEHTLLHGFVRDLEQWPPCHVFVVLRPKDPALRYVQDMQREYGDAAAIVDLGQLELADVDEQARLIAHLHAHLPVTINVEDDELLAMLDGYAGVIGRWLKAHTKPHSFEALKQLANDAHANRYPELEPVFDGLRDTDRDLAIRLALMDFAGIESWDVLQNEILAGRSMSALDLLRRFGVLEASDPPTYGHAKRAEMARALLAERYPHGLHAACAYLVGAYADQVVNTGQRCLSFAWAIRGLDVWAKTSGLYTPNADEQRLVYAARALLGEPVPRGALCGASGISKGSKLLAIAMDRVLSDMVFNGDLAGRDVILTELRSLADVFGEPAWRDRLVEGLICALSFAEPHEKKQLQLDLIDELRQVAASPDGSTLPNQIGLMLVAPLLNCAGELETSEDEAFRESLAAVLADLCPPEEYRLVLQFVEFAAVHIDLAGGNTGTLPDTEV